jgi:Leucine-rich repeat (LRR) protein
VQLNRLESIPDQIGDRLPNLTRLSLGGNEIASLPESIWKLTKLQAFLVHDNRLSPTDFTVITQFVAAATALTDLKCLNQKTALVISDASIAQIAQKERDAITSKSSVLLKETIALFRDNPLKVLASLQVGSNARASANISSGVVVKTGWLVKVRTLLSNVSEAHGTYSICSVLDI